MKKILTFFILLLLCSSAYAAKVVIAVDAGHGGKDSGACLLYTSPSPRD